MRDMNHNTTPVPLGPPIRPTEAPTAPQQVRPGIWRDQDGKLRTDIPPPPAEPPVWPFNPGGAP